MLKAIIFDFDGVIVDSEPVHFRAFQEVARSFGFGFDYRHYLEHYIGFDDRDGFRHMLREAGRPAEEARVRELCEAKQEVFERMVGEGVPMIPGARDLIEEASSQLPIAIASGATRADIELVLAGLKLRDRFALIVSADDVASSKPHPLTYALAAERLAAANPAAGLEPRACLAIEDTAAGVASARGAGLRTLGLTTTGPAEKLREADRVIDDLAGVTLGQLGAWYVD
jgi:beta-phosphoglucomutase